MECRKCGACCIAPSISSPIPGMPNGKPANTPCVHLSADMLCLIWDREDRPAVCRESKADSDFCGSNFDEAIRIFNSLL